MHLRNGKRITQQVDLFALRADDGRFEQIDDTTLALKRRSAATNAKRALRPQAPDRRR